MNGEHVGRFWTLTVAVLLSLAMPRWGQAQDTSALVNSQEASAALQAPPDTVVVPEEWADDEFVSAPRQVVAQLIRAALQSPENREAWLGLAEALPELGEAEEGESYVALLRASRIADSLALATGGAGGGPADGGDSVKGGEFVLLLARAGRGVELAVNEVVAWMTEHDVVVVFTLSGFLIALILLKGREPWARSSGRNRAGQAMAGEYLLREGTSKGLATARALWSSGLPVHEIARRTGLAQDALAVMLSMQRSSDG